jgi:hypothetical protein
MMGLAAMQALLFAYYRASMKFERHGIVMPALISIVAYFVVVSLLQFITQNVLIAIALSLASIAVFGYLLRGVEDNKIKEMARPGVGVLLIRAIVAAMIILAVIESAYLVVPKWAGLFSAFPTTVFPLLLIVHYTYGKKHVQTIIKNVSVGLSTVVAYSLTVSVAYPMVGMYYGTVAAYGAAFVVCMLIYLFYLNRDRGRAKSRRQ